MQHVACWRWKSGWSARSASASRQRKQQAPPNLVAPSLRTIGYLRELQAQLQRLLAKLILVGFLQNALQTKLQITFLSLDYNRKGECDPVSVLQTRCDVSSIWDSRCSRRDCQLGWAMTQRYILSSLHADERSRPSYVRNASDVWVGG
mmetsp:Transcript_491/g.1153  ORF Transcript_491/g.1153 Transcript_491/m.1153 type:complete len:148 (+) Transcript_491:445-888(+)